MDKPPKSTGKHTAARRDSVSSKTKGAAGAGAGAGAGGGGASGARDAAGSGGKNASVSKSTSNTPAAVTTHAAGPPSGACARVGLAVGAASAPSRPSPAVHAVHAVPASAVTLTSRQQQSDTARMPPPKQPTPKQPTPSAGRPPVAVPPHTTPSATPRPTSAPPTAPQRKQQAQQVHAQETQQQGQHTQQQGRATSSSSGAQPRGGGVTAGGGGQTAGRVAQGGACCNVAYCIVLVSYRVQLRTYMHHQCVRTTTRIMLPIPHTHALTNTTHACTHKHTPTHITGPPPPQTLSQHFKQHRAHRTATSWAQDLDSNLLMNKGVDNVQQRNTLLRETLMVHTNWPLCVHQLRGKCMAERTCMYVGCLLCGCWHALSALSLSLCVFLCTVVA